MFLTKENEYTLHVKKKKQIIEGFHHNYPTHNGVVKVAANQRQREDKLTECSAKLKTMTIIFFFFFLNLLMKRKSDAPVRVITITHRAQTLARSIIFEFGRFTGRARAPEWEVFA